MNEYERKGRVSRVESPLDRRLTELTRRADEAMQYIPETDLDVIGPLLQPCDVGQPFVTGVNNYRILMSLAWAAEPRVILELGSRFGYSLRAMVLGSSDGETGEQGQRLYVVDGEVDGLNCLAVLESHFRAEPLVPHLATLKALTQELLSLEDFLGPDFGRVDLALVDGRHTEEGCFHECRLAWEALRPGGLLLVDDMDNAEVLAGFQRFMKQLGPPLDACGRNFQIIPTLHRLAVTFKDQPGGHYVRQTLP